MGFSYQKEVVVDEVDVVEGTLQHVRQVLLVDVIIDAFKLSLLQLESGKCFCNIFSLVTKPVTCCLRHMSNTVVVIDGGLRKTGNEETLALNSDTLVVLLRGLVRLWA